MPRNVFTTGPTDLRPASASPAKSSTDGGIIVSKLVYLWITMDNWDGVNFEPANLENLRMFHFLRHPYDVHRTHNCPPCLSARFLGSLTLPCIQNGHFLYLGM